MALFKQENFRGILTLVSGKKYARLIFQCLNTVYLLSFE